MFEEIVPSNFATAVGKKLSKWEESKKGHVSPFLTVISLPQHF
jgi:hypothetical protein